MDRGSGKEDYRVFFDNSLAPLFTHSLDGTLLTINRAFAVATGYSPEELIAGDFRKLLSADSGQRFDDYLKEIMEKRRAESTFEIMTSSGRELVWQVSSRLYDCGQGLCVLSCCLDRTEVADAKKSKDKFISLLSHEVRSPLTCVKGAMDHLTGPVNETLPEKTKKMIAIGATSTDRIIRLVTDIVDLERIESGKLELNGYPTPLTRLVEQAIDSSRSLAEAYHMNIALQKPPAEITVDVDPDRLVQVVGNLLSNAIRFSPEGGTVSISVRLKDGSAHVSVKDNGPGISGDLRLHMFERFMQRPDPHRQKGIGLGLAISRAIIRKFGGEIGFESSPETGTTFFFDLPVAET